MLMMDIDEVKNYLRAEEKNGYIITKEERKILESEVLTKEQIDKAIQIGRLIIPFISLEAFYECIQSNILDAIVKHYKISLMELAEKHFDTFKYNVLIMGKPDTLLVNYYYDYILNKYTIKIKVSSQHLEKVINYYGMCIPHSIIRKITRELKTYTGAFDGIG